MRCDRNARWQGFHQPFLSPFLFEDPFITSGLHAHFIWHEFPRRSIFAGGDLEAVAVQARLALTDRLAFIATKDGRVWIEPDLAIVDNRGGWFNLAGGLKYAFLVKPESQFILSGVLRYEAPTGSSDVFQGHGPGLLMPSLTSAWGIGPVRLLGDFGATVPMNSRQDSAYLFYHLYANLNLHERVAPFIQLSGQHWVGSGNGLRPVDLDNGPEIPLRTAQAVLGIDPFEGLDVINLGAQDVDGNDVLALGVGLHVVLSDVVTFNMAYERPIGTRKDLFKQRATASIVFEL